MKTRLLVLDFSEYVARKQGSVEAGKMEKQYGKKEMREKVKDKEKDNNKGLVCKYSFSESNTYFASLTQCQEMRAQIVGLYYIVIELT